MTDTLAAAWMPHLHEHGYALVPAVLGASEVAVLLAALDEAGEADADGVRRRESVYAIRNLLEVVPAIRALARSPAVRALVEPVLGKAAFAVRGILFDKTPDANWKVAWPRRPPGLRRRRAPWRPAVARPLVIRRGRRACASAFVRGESISIMQDRLSRPGQTARMKYHKT